MKVSKEEWKNDWKSIERTVYRKAVSTDYEPKNTPYKSIEIDT